MDLSALSDSRYALSSDRFAGFSTLIEVAGKPAEVYGVKEDNALREVTASIEGQAGAKFAIWIFDNRQFADVTVAIDFSLEGKSLDSRTLLNESPHLLYPIGSDDRKFRFGGAFESSKHTRSFESSAIPHTSQRIDAVTDLSSISSVATISLTLTRCRGYKTLSHVEYDTVRSRVDLNVNDKIKNTVLEEREKKAQFAFAAGLSDVQQVPAANQGFVQTIGRESEYFVKFTRTVWSRAGLEIRGLVEAPDTSTSDAASTSSGETSSKRGRSTSSLADHHSPNLSSSQQLSSIKAQIASLQQQVTTIEEENRAVKKVKKKKEEVQVGEEVKVIRKGKVLYIDFDEDEAEEEERKKD